MKNFPRLLILSALCLALSTSCSKSKPLTPAAGGQTDVSNATREQLEQAIADRDQLILLTSDIQQSLDEIAELENMVSVDASELPDQRTQIRTRMANLRILLEQRRSKLDSLERELSKSSLYNSNMENTIKGLRFVGGHGTQMDGYSQAYLSGSEQARYMLLDMKEGK